MQRAVLPAGFCCWLRCCSSAALRSCGCARRRFWSMPRCAPNLLFAERIVLLEKPTISDESIVARLQSDYASAVDQLTFLPLGFDLNSAVFRAEAATGRAYFVKLRRGAFDPICVELPRFLSDSGVRQIIAPVPTQFGRLWSDVEAFTLIVYPFVEGRTARETVLTEEQWRDFGAAVKHLHAVPMPPTILQRLRRLKYSSKWRERV